jgi:hypothetical protein
MYVNVVTGTTVQYSSSILLNRIEVVNAMNGNSLLLVNPVVLSKALLFV